MSGRRFPLAISFAIGLALYALLFAIAPHVRLFRAKISSAAILERFQVSLREDVFAQPEPSHAENGVASRPGSVEDMLRRDPEALALPGPEDAPPAEVARLDERAAVDKVARAHDLERDETVLKRVDAKIIEIAREDARLDIKVARRLVRPSPDRILGPDEFPTLRSVLAKEPPRPLDFDSKPKSLLGNDEAGTGAAGDGVPEFEEGVHEATGARRLASAPKRAAPVVARARVDAERSQAKEESRYAFLDDLVDIRLDTYQDPGEEQGYFRLRILPKADKEIDALPKDVQFVVDASRSISAHKLSRTVAGLRASIGQLRAEDRFNITAFRDHPTPFRATAVPATDENKAAAVDFLDELESRGETDVYQGILSVVQEPPRLGMPGIVLLLSDGRPTTGLQDGRAIINGLSDDNALRNSIYAFGGGRTVNRYLLDLLAYRNKGACEVAKDVGAIDEDLPAFFERLRDPLLVDLNADFSRVREEAVFPKVLPDFYRDRAVTVYGRYDPEQPEDFVMRLSGRAGEREKEALFRADLTKAEKGGDEIAWNWAFQKAYDIIGEMSRDGETPERLAELRNLCRKYEIRTSYDE